MTDIHCHVLPGLDDGAQSLEEALEMCSTAENNGIGDIIATPHLKSLDDVREFIVARSRAASLLGDALMNAGIDVSIHEGAEVFARRELEQLEDLSPLTLNRSRYILIEFDFFGNQTGRIEKHVRLLQDRGLTPIIAHPERYECFLSDPDALEYIGETGSLFQCNSTSLSGMHGEKVRRLATDMVTAGYADFIATDAHSDRFRSTDLMKMMRSFSRDIEEGDIELLCSEYPSYILNDRPFPARKRGYLAE